jgi:hypothetical protein
MASLETDRFAAWLRGLGATVHDGLELFGKRADGERGVFAVRPIAKGEMLLHLPTQASITACDNSDECCGWMPAAARQASPVLRTALYLMREQSRGADSPWATYLASLPSAYSTLEHWTKAELAELEGTCVYDEISTLRDESGELIGPARVLWEKSIAPMVHAEPALWPDASFTSFLNACAAVRTRGFFDTADGGTGGPFMLPAVDMLNHACTATATTLTVERLGGARVFSMEAERDIEAGEEVVHVYDQLDSSQLLLTYGFVASEGEGALPATARLPLPLLLEACEAVRTDGRLGWDASDGWDAKVEACTRLLAPHGGQVGVSVSEPLPDALVTVALLLLVPREDFEDLLSEGAPSDGGGGSSAKVPTLDASALEDEPILAAAVVQAIVAAVSSAEGRYRSSEAEKSAGVEEGVRRQRKVDVHERRVADARAIRDAELQALGATRRAALKLLVTVGLGGSDDEENEDEDDDDEEEDDDDDEEDEEEDDDDEEEDEDEEAEKSSSHHDKKQRHG